MTKMREISFAFNASADEVFEMLPAPIQGVISTIRAEKDSGSRPMPSSTLIDRSTVLTPKKRSALLDFVASLVDENLTGRSDMCFQFALLIELALTHLNIASRNVLGEAIYFTPLGEELFRWTHAWVRVGSEVVDGNTDIIWENPMVAAGVKVSPYWGPIKGIPERRLIEQNTLQEDTDVTAEWWPRLRAWLESDFRQLD